MNFYEKVTSETALQWYAELPPHLKKRIDDTRLKYTDGKECNNKECPEIYERVKLELGNRPLRPADPKDPLEGHTQKQIEQYNRLKLWGNRYNELLLIKIVLDNAEQLQRERRALNEAMGLNVDAADLPNQSDGLEPTQAATIKWLQQTGEMPLEFLARTFRSEEAKMSDRLAAARTLMDYAHRKVPVKTETETKDISAPKLAPEVLKKLSSKELDLLEQLLGKLGG